MVGFVVGDLSEFLNWEEVDVSNKIPGQNAYHHLQDLQNACSHWKTSTSPIRKFGMVAVSKNYIAPSSQKPQMVNIFNQCKSVKFQFTVQVIYFITANYMDMEGDSTEKTKVSKFK